MQPSESEYIASLITLNKGAAVELFDSALKEVLDNIADPNAEAEAVREIIIKVRMKPSESRESAAVSIECSSKLAQPKASPGVVYFGKSEGQRVAVQSNPTQGGLFDAPGTVHHFNKEA